MLSVYTTGYENGIKNACSFCPIIYIMLNRKVKKKGWKLIPPSFAYVFDNALLSGLHN